MLSVPEKRRCVQHTGLTGRSRHRSVIGVMNSLTSTVTLNNGVEMPWVGLGVYKSAPGSETETAVRYALDAGYRHVDTASFYENEQSVGVALAAHDVPVEEVFVTTKLWNDDHGFDRTLRAFDVSMEKLGLETLDLYLIHWPMPDTFAETWKALGRLYSEGRVRAIGVSNFLEHHLRTLAEQSEIVPAVNQIEFHPMLVQQPLLEYCRSFGIRVEAWSPLIRGLFFGHETIARVAEECGKTPAQVLVRWDLQHGVVTIPKSVHRERIVENADVFDFELSETQMQALDELDRNYRLGPHPDEIGR